MAKTVRTQHSRIQITWSKNGTIMIIESNLHTIDSNKTRTRLRYILAPVFLSGNIQADFIKLSSPTLK